MRDRPSAVPAPPTTLACNRLVLPKGTRLHRIHQRHLSATTFNPGFGASRFAPLERGARKIPTAYAATSLECAIFEAIFHDIDADAAFKSVLWSELDELDYSIIELGRDVSLAKLFAPDLLSWGLERKQLIDTPRSSYPLTRPWSAAIHAAGDDLAGMIWTSRKYDEERALMLFGDRVTASDLMAAGTVEIVRHADTLQFVQDQADRSGIVIVR